MNNDIISGLRMPIDPPNKLVDESGQAIFGTFNKEIPCINLLDCDKPTGKKLSKFMKNVKLTRWEATEIVTKRYAIVTAVYGMGPLGFAIIVLWDRKENKITSYLKPSTDKHIKIAENLIDSLTELDTKKLSVSTTNNLHQAHAKTIGKCENKKKGNIEFNVDLNRLANPCIVSIPFGPNMPLYSQKDFLKADGYIEFNGEKILTDEDSVAIIDDHKGYYPRKAHYDWLTTMGRINHNGKDIYLALNLTKNQSIDEYNYNENLLWLEDKTYPLPPITFEKGEDIWHVHDEFGRVDIKFTIENRYKIVTNLGLIKVDYHLPFGHINGFVTDDKGEKYIVDDMIGITEDKTTLL